MKFFRFTVLALLLIAVMAVSVAPSIAQDTSLPRNETLYLNGQQWNALVGWNPYSKSMNNYTITPQDSSRELVYETPYAYDMLNGEQVPLLADGPYSWNDAHTELSYKIKAA